jgi:hypothetical protein
MNRKPRSLLAAVVALAVLGAMTGVALAQNAPSEHPAIPGAAPPSVSGPGWESEQDMSQAPQAPLPAPVADLPVLYITGVEIMTSTTQPELDIVRVTGLASSEGWSAPQLVPTYAGKPFDGILDLQLIATPPDHSEDADGFAPVSAIFPLEPGGGLAGVRVRGAENAMTLRHASGAGDHLAVQVDTNDCHACVGQKFAANGTASQPQQGMIRQEDLPKLLRIIRANDGIRGREQNPNRLSLILGDDNTILEAFWE